MNHPGGENLRPFNTLTLEEHRAITTLGGLASGESRRKKRTFKEMLKIMMELPAPLETIEELKKVIPQLPDGMTMQEVMNLQQLIKSAKGELSSFETVRDTIGEVIIRKQEITGSDGEPLVSPLIVFGQEIPKKEDAPAAGS